MPAHRLDRTADHLCEIEPLTVDRQLLATLSEGRGRETAALTGEELDKTGNIELRTWITLLGAVGNARAEVLCYEPSWHHGNAVVAWPV